MTTQLTTTARRWTMQEIEAANKAAGLFYFSEGTMRGFRCRLSNEVYQGPGGVYFVTSEQFRSSGLFGSAGIVKPRRYTVRKFAPETGDCTTAPENEFNKLTSRQAHSLAAQLAAGPCAYCGGPIRPDPKQPLRETCSDVCADAEEHTR